jgi:hypothetical protein
MAVATVAYLAAYVLVLDEGPLIKRLQRVAPHVGVFGVWALIYRLGGFGAQGNGFYLDPVGAPLTFLAGLMDRVPLLVLGQWTPIPAAMGLVYAPGSPDAVRVRIESLLVVAVLIVLFFPLVRRDRVTRFFAVGMTLSLVPISGAAGQVGRGGIWHIACAARVRGHDGRGIAGHPPLSRARGGARICRVPGACQ